MERYSPSNIDVGEMSGEMEERRRRVEESCVEVLEPEEREEVNSGEFLISDKYKLIWCNIFKAASSTWLYNYLIMGGKVPEELKRLRISPVEAARELYPRPGRAKLMGHLAGGNKERYLSFIIVREPFQRLLSAYRDKIETIVPYYKQLRCQITKKYPIDTEKLKAGWWEECKPNFSQFVSFLIDEEREGRAPNEHWAPYYKFCSPCVASFDVVLRFESLHNDEMYLLEKVPGLSKVVSPKVIHSSHFNYSALTSSYFKQLTTRQLLGLLKIYLPDFRLFGYTERPYLDYVG
ncbi:carbohydrate sulfotransferase 11-like [Portunus trituberculatus]|uniref:carbohydrate sulfotransferase 11-like n=1 Tax=Portunus trituberculatus TaxID=210409 RepID=UPI001E1CF0D5|nr:carbohydrate sulfotransferase 11-like [Portunus trituberculatus]